MNKRTVAAFLALAGFLSADTLSLKNGSVINGRFVSGDGQSVRFAVGGQTNTYDIVDIDSLRFSGPGSDTATPVAPTAAVAPVAPATPPPPPPPQQGTSSSSSSSATTPYGPASASPNSSPAPADPGQNANSAVNTVELPAGTQIVVRLIDPADSQRDSLGKTYRASVEQPVMLNGQTVIPRGSDAVAVLTDETKSGKLSGKTMLTLGLRSVSVNGRTYDLTTSSVSKASGSRGTRSGELIGGGAALGAIIGALAGGGRGAAVGALSGGALGTAAQVATSGEKVKVPAETVLTFALQNALDIATSYN